MYSHSPGWCLYGSFQQRWLRSKHSRVIGTETPQNDVMTLDAVGVGVRVSVICEQASYTSTTAVGELLKFVRSTYLDHWR